MEEERKRLVEGNLDIARQVLHQKLGNPASVPDGALVIPLNLLAGSKNR